MTTNGHADDCAGKLDRDFSPVQREMGRGGGIMPPDTASVAGGAKNRLSGAVGRDTSTVNPAYLTQTELLAEVERLRRLVASFGDSSVVELAIKLADMTVERDAAAANARAALGKVDRLTAMGLDEGRRCRVVTSPRFYSDAERECAITAASQTFTRGDGSATVRQIFGRIVCGRIVDAVAQALGMRKAV